MSPHEARRIRRLWKNFFYDLSGERKNPQGVKKRAPFAMGTDTGSWIFYIYKCWEAAMGKDRANLPEKERERELVNDFLKEYVRGFDSFYLSFSQCAHIPTINPAHVIKSSLLSSSSLSTASEKSFSFFSMQIYV